MKSGLRFILLAALVTACTTTEELRNQPSCSIWKDQGSLGANHIKVTEARVKERSDCLIYFWWCSSYESRIEADGKILAKGPWGSERHVATLQGNEVVYAPSFADVIAKASPIQIDMDKHKAKRTVQIAFLKDTKNDQELEFNPSCTKQEAAVGAVSFWILENKRK